MMSKLALILFSITLITACSKPNTDRAEIDSLAREYIKLGLEIGHYDDNFVDAYYGPDSLRQDYPEYIQFPKDILLEKTAKLQKRLGDYVAKEENIEFLDRAKHLTAGLTAFAERIRIVGGETSDFDVETMALFGVEAPHFPEAYFQEGIDKLNHFLPGDGELGSRFEDLSNQFIIPVEKLDTVIKSAIAEARRRTHEHYPIPKNESFTLEYVNDKAWSGYNWYQGNYSSLIQINTDYPIGIERIIDVGSHESYPGHHVYNMLLEENLYHKKGYIELSLYPLFNPQSFIAEGSANYGIEVAFPGEDKIHFAKEVLLPLAGLDTTGIHTYFRALEIIGELSYFRNEVGRAYLNGTMDEEQAINWIMKYGLFSEEKAKQSLKFTEKYRSYIINYNYGKDLVKNYIESRGGTAENQEKRWELFGELLSKQVLPADLK